MQFEFHGSQEVTAMPKEKTTGGQPQRAGRIRSCVVNALSDAAKLTLLWWLPMITTVLIELDYKSYVGRVTWGQLVLGLILGFVGMVTFFATIISGFLWIGWTQAAWTFGIGSIFYVLGFLLHLVWNAWTKALD